MATLYQERLLHTFKKMNKKVGNNPNCLSPNVNELLASGRTKLAFLYAHLSDKINTHKIFNKPNCLLQKMVFSTWTKNNWLFVCTLYLYRRPSLRSQNIPRIPKPLITRDHCFGIKRAKSADISKE